MTDGPEVHADGEIWAQTLWQLRQLLGQTLTESLVTRAMELSPPEPSFLDMRNAILQADLVANAGVNQDAIWGVFAQRGMGYFSSATDGSDTAPVEDFSLPPDCAVDPCGTIHGRITSKATGKGLKDVSVYVGGLASGFGNDLGTRTAADGTFLIEDVPFHDAYAAVVVDAPGYEQSVALDFVVDGDEVLSRKVNRDWAALEAGAKLVSATPPDYTAFGCGPANAFDLAMGAGWGSDAPGSVYGSNVTGPRKAVVKLPKAISVTTFGVASMGTCGDGPGAGVKGFTIQTRTAERRLDHRREGERSERRGSADLRAQGVERVEEGPLRAVHHAVDPRGRPVHGRPRGDGPGQVAGAGRGPAGSHRSGRSQAPAAWASAHAASSRSGPNEALGM